MAKRSNSRTMNLAALGTCLILGTLQAQPAAAQAGEDALTIGNNADDPTAVDDPMAVDVTQPDAAPVEVPAEQADTRPLKLPEPESYSVTSPEIATTRSLRSQSARGKTVSGRARHEYDPVGIRAGSFLVYPSVSASTNGTTNLYRQPTGDADVFWRGEGAIDAISQWSRHELNLTASAGHSIYVQHSTEDATTAFAGAGWRIDVNRDIALEAGGSYEHGVSSRNAVDEVQAFLFPTEWDEIKADATLRRSTERWESSLSFGFRDRQFNNNTLLDGTRVSFDDREFQVYQIGGEVAYGFSGGRQIFVSGSWSKRNFDVVSVPRRDVRIAEVLAGLESEITPLLHGRFGAGYVNSNFKDPSVGTRESLALDVDLDYLLSELTTLSLQARRTLGGVADVNSVGFTQTYVRAGADHEFLRNLIFSLYSTYTKADYFGANNGDIDLYGADFSARWLVNQKMEFDLLVEYNKRDEAVIQPNNDIDALFGSVGFTYNF